MLKVEVIAKMYNKTYMKKKKKLTWRKGLLKILMRQFFKPIE